MARIEARRMARKDGCQLKREQMFDAAEKAANLAIRLANDNLSDAKQILHAALTCVHADESERRSGTKTNKVGNEIPAKGRTNDN